MKNQPSLLQNALEESSRSHSLIGVYSNPDYLETFSVGWICGLTDDCYALTSLDESGQADEVQIGLKEDIIRINVGGPYLDSFSRMQVPPSAWPSLDVPVLDFAGVLSWCASERRVVSISDRGGEKTTGLPRECDGQHLRLSTYDRAANYDADEIVWLGYIQRIELFGIKQRHIEKRLFDSLFEEGR